MTLLTPHSPCLHSKRSDERWSFNFQSQQHQYEYNLTAHLCLKKGHKSNCELLNWLTPISRTGILNFLSLFICSLLIDIWWNLILYPQSIMWEAEDLIILTRCSIRVGFLSGTGRQQIPSVPPCDSQTILSSQISDRSANTITQSTSVEHTHCARYMGWLFRTLHITS